MFIQSQFLGIHLGER